MSIGFHAPEDAKSSGADPSLVASSGDAARSSVASSFVVLGRLLLLLAAATALAAGMLLARAHDHALYASVDSYVCPMHPEVVSSAPGDCPICGMALELMTNAERSANGMSNDEASFGRAERRVFAEQVRAAAWLGTDGLGTAVLYEDDLVGLQPDEPAQFFGGSAPNMGIDVQLLPEPPSSVDASTSKVRFRLVAAASAPSLAAGSRDVGSLQIRSHARELLVVPASAVLYSGQGPYVLAAASCEGTFSKRLVQIGRILDSGYVGGRAGSTAGAIVILSGLSEGERVITANTFFLDAERRLQAARGSGDGVMP